MNKTREFQEIERFPELLNKDWLMKYLGVKAHKLAMIIGGNSGFPPEIVAGYHSKAQVDQWLAGKRFELNYVEAKADQLLKEIGG